LVILALLVCASAVYAVGDQAYLGMFVDTSVMKMAGMPTPKLPPGIDLSKLPKVPGMERLMNMGAPNRKLEVRLWTPGLAPANASASIAAPGGLMQGPQLDLDIYRPKAEEAKGEISGGVPGGPAGQTELTIKYYWGSSATVKPGQPKVIKFGSLTPDQKRVMNESARKARAAGSYFYKPDWTTGYWPTTKQPGEIDKDAVLPGTYSLTTNYCGNVSIDCPSNVDFLAAIEMTSPDLEKRIPMDQAIAFEWKPIANLLGSHAKIIGMEGKNTIIIWSSSEIWREDMMSVDWGYLQMAEVKQFVKDTIMMAGNRTTVTVPAGIFKSCDMANMQMVGYGPGAARADVQPIPRIQTKTSLNLMLGGKGMQMPDQEGEGQIPGEENT
jgi:hypothetical protein